MMESSGMTSKKTRLTIEDPRDAVEFWRGLGFNVIPALTQEKLITEPWKRWQDNHIPDEQYGEWYHEKKFNDGMAILLGKVYTNPVNKNQAPVYGIGIDCDNQAGIDLVLSALGYSTLSDASKHVIVESHKDESYRAHFIFYSDQPLPKKGIYTGPVKWDVDMKEQPRVEIKDLLFVSPSIHKNGHPYQIVRGGTMNPEVLNTLQERFEEAFKKYGIPYANNAAITKTDNTTGYKIDGDITSEHLFEPEFKIPEGEKNIKVHRFACKLLYRNQNLMEEIKIKAIVEEYNEKYCAVPLEAKEINRIWKSVKKFVASINGARAYERQKYQERKTREAYEQEFYKGERRKI